MGKKELVQHLIKKGNGVLFTKVAANNNIDNKTLKRLSDSGTIERIAHGVYIDPMTLKDEYLITQLKCSRGVFSHETALYLHDYSDRLPFKLMLTIPSGSNTRLLKDKNKYQFFYINRSLHSMGKISMKSPLGNNINVYNIERTICDCVRSKDKLDINLVTTAIREYMQNPNRELRIFLEYAEKLKVGKEIRQYLEVLS